MDPLTSRQRVRKIFDSVLNSPTKPEPIIERCTDATASRILFVCSQNIRRSKTGEDLFCRSYNVRSAGLWCGNTKKTKEVTLEMLQWANIIFVFEQLHVDEIKKRFKNDGSFNVVNLRIDDNYVRGNAALTRMLLNKVPEQISLQS